MKNKIKTLAFVLKKRNQGESSRVISMLTREVGQVDVLVNGMRKPLHRYSGVLQSFNLVGVVLRTSPVYYMLEEATLVKSYQMIDQQLRGVGLGNVMLEVISQASRDDDAGRFFNLLNDYLLAYDDNKKDIYDNSGLMVFLSSFIMSVLAVAGRMPIVDGCWVCGRERGDDWQVTSGGLSHRQCLGVNLSCQNISKEAVKGLWMVENQACDQLIKNFWPDGLAKEVLTIMLFWYHLFYEKKMKSLDFLDEVYRRMLSDHNDSIK